MSRRILVVAHPQREGSPEALDFAVARMRERGATPVVDYVQGETEPVDAALVLGGDGTMLHAAAETHGSGIPLLGVNLGRVGFLAEAEREDLELAVDALSAGDFTVEERGTLEFTVERPDGTTAEGWALNDATIERPHPRRTLEVAVAVDDQPVSSFGCDGVVVATATGSTAHAFSAGGPVIWPSVRALLLVPLAAHALFARPLVVGPGSTFGVTIRAESRSEGVLVADGARAIELPTGSRVVVRHGEQVVRLVRLSAATFTERLVNKFSLPIDGWHGERPATER